MQCLNAAGDVCLDLALIARTTECIFHVSRESEVRLLALRDAIGSEDEEALVASQEKCVNLQLLAQRSALAAGLGTRHSP